MMQPQHQQVPVQQQWQIAPRYPPPTNVWPPGTVLLRPVAPNGHSVAHPYNPALYGSYVPAMSASTSTRGTRVNGDTVGYTADRQSSSECHSKTNLYIRGLLPNTTDESLQKLCERFGTVKSTKAMMDPLKSECKGFGFVDFVSEQEAETALRVLQEEGMKVQMAKARQQECDDSNLYIRNLSPNCTEANLEQHLSAFGPVISTRILRDQSGKCTGVGFARMESTEKCQMAIDALNGSTMSNWREPLIVKFAVAGNKMKKKYIDYSGPASRENIPARFVQPPIQSNGFVNTANRMPLLTPMSPPQLVPMATPNLPTLAAGPHYQQYPAMQMPLVYNSATGTYEPAYGLAAPQPYYQVFTGYTTAVDPNMMSLQMSQLQLDQSRNSSRQYVDASYSGTAYPNGQ